jgi:putative intracellular protease/amidase
MKPCAYLLVFDGLADWEPAHAFCQINKSGKFQVVTVGFSREPVTSMAGLRIVPSATLDELDPAETSFFMLPGGDMWQEKSHETLHPLLRGLHDRKVLIGAICAATLEIARAGLTRGVRHTSNAKSYLKEMVPGYRDDDFYVDQLAVTDQNIITASGLGSVEFAREVLTQLRIYSDADTAVWFEMFKHGVVPAGML